MIALQSSSSGWRAAAGLVLFTSSVGSQAPSLEATVRARLDSLSAHSTFYAKQLSTGGRWRFAPTSR